MNKVITINLNGAAYQLEESGYEALRSYLDSAARRLEGNPDRDEIITDIEQAIGDKCRAVLGAHKSVVLTKEIEQIIAEMGPVEDGSAEGPGPRTEADPRAPGSPAADPADESAVPRKRFYRIREGAMLGGVCNGLATYFDLDVTIVRVLFVVITLTWGLGVATYIVLWIVAPRAETEAERAAAGGEMPFTAREFVRRAKAGYYEGMRTFADKREMRGWRQAFRHEMRANRDHWREHWRHHGAERPHPDLALVLPLLVLARGLLACLGFCALISLLATGAVFGILLPVGLPIWAAVVLLVLFYKLVTWPIRALHRACFWSGGAGYGHPLLGLWDTTVGLGCVLVLLWLGWHHADQVRTAIGAIPSECHQAVAAISRWWRRR